MDLVTRDLDAVVLEGHVLWRADGELGEDVDRRVLGDGGGRGALALQGSHRELVVLVALPDELLRGVAERLVEELLLPREREHLHARRDRGEQEHQRRPGAEARHLPAQVLEVARVGELAAAQVETWRARALVAAQRQRQRQRQRGRLVRGDLLRRQSGQLERLDGALDLGRERHRELGQTRGVAGEEEAAHRPLDVQ